MKTIKAPIYQNSFQLHQLEIKKNIAMPWSDCIVPPQISFLYGMLTVAPGSIFLPFMTVSFVVDLTSSSLSSATPFFELQEISACSTAQKKVTSASRFSRDESYISRYEILVSREATLVSRDENLVSRESLKWTFWNINEFLAHLSRDATRANSG